MCVWCGKEEGEEGESDMGDGGGGGGMVEKEHHRQSRIVRKRKIQLLHGLKYGKLTVGGSFS